MILISYKNKEELIGMTIQRKLRIACILKKDKSYINFDLILNFTIIYLTTHVKRK